MASSVNMAILVGRVGKDPQPKTLESGKTLVNFSLATSEKYKDEETTVWHNIVAFGKLAEIIEKYVHKGDEIYLSGKISNRSYDDKDGNKKNISEIIANEMKMFGGKKGEQTQHSEPEPEPFDPSDDLPF